MELKDIVPSGVRMTVPLGDYDWYVLDVIGNRYLLFAATVQYRGFYSLRPCDYRDSRLCEFLKRQIYRQLGENGVDTSMISNPCVLSEGQYRMYVAGKIPSDRQYLLMNRYENPENIPEYENCICSVDPSGQIKPFSMFENCGVRPCLYVNSEYLLTVLNCSESDIAIIANLPFPESDDIGQKEPADEIPIPPEEPETFLETPEEQESEENSTVCPGEDNPPPSPVPVELPAEQDDGKNSEFSDVCSDEPEVVSAPQEGAKEDMLPFISDAVPADVPEIVYPEEICDIPSEPAPDKEDNPEEEHLPVQDVVEDGMHSVYQYDGPFSRFSIVYDDSEDFRRIRDALIRKGVVIRQMAQLPSDSTPVSFDDIFDNISVIQNFWKEK